jgi:SAM-dependent methyltransferase
LTKQQRGSGEDLLFSQSELAELDAELAPQPDDLVSARTPPQATPASLDDLVDSAFSDEATVEKRPDLVADGVDLGSGFDGFVEAEPASTGEILAAMAEQPISSAPALDEPPRDAGKVPIAMSGEISGSATTPVPVPQNLPSVMFDDSPFPESEGVATVDPAEIAPQLAALAAAIDNRQPGAMPVADAVLSSSPPPSDDNLGVEVVTAGGGSLPHNRAPALVALTHAVQEGDGAGPEDEAAADAARPSGNTPVMALDDHEFQLVEDSEEQPAAGIHADGDAEAESSVADGLDEGSEAAEGSAEDGSVEAQVTQPLDPLDPAIDAAWSAVAEESSPPVAGSTVEDLSPVDLESALGEGEPAQEPLSSRVTPILGVPTIQPAASHVEAEAEPLGEGVEGTAEVESGVESGSEPAADLATDIVESDAPLSDDIEPVVAAATATAAAASNVSPLREAPAPPVAPPVPPKEALRRPAPGAPPPPPPAALASSQKPPPPPPAPVASPSSSRPAHHVAPSAPPPPPPGGINFGEETKLRKKRRSKQWFEEIFDEDYLHTLPFMTPHQTEREVAFLLETLELPAGGRVLDLGCGYGRHAMEMASRGYRTVGIDLSLPLLIRATDAARRVGVNVDFVHGDMRDMSFDGEFDGAYCFYTTFGYFDDDTNRRVAAGICKALKPGGRFVLELINRDYLIGDLPTRVWWQGDGCVVLEEVDFNYFTSRLQVQRQIILENGRQLEQDISIRAYSLHEIGKVLHHAGFRVLEVSGNLDLRGRFYGNESRQLVVVAERRPEGA